MQAQDATTAQAPAAAAAAAQLEHEEAWRLLLEHLMHPDADMFCHVYDVSREKFICSLLASSSAMTDLVYKACEGELRLSMSLYHLPRCVSAGNWLGSHARLLRELAVYGPPSDGPEVEAAVAAGLQAASGRSGAPSLPDTQLRARSRWHFLNFKPKQQPQLCEQPQQQRQGAACAPSRLLLRKLHVQVPCSGRILAAVAGSRQLTALSVTMRALDDVPASQEALRTLTELRELDLDLSSARHDSQVLEGLAPPLQSLSQLTRLEVRAAFITQTNLECFPASLQSLTLQFGERLMWDLPAHAPLNFSSLNELTALDISRLLGEDVLPPRLRRLVLPCGFESLQPVVGLTCLESFSCCSIPPADDLEALHELGTLREVMFGGRPGWQLGVDPNQLVSELAALPLVSVQLRGVQSHLSPALVGSMWRWKQLQRLHLDGVHIDGSFAGLSEQLVDLPQLEYLRMCSVTACPGDRAWLYRERPEHERRADLKVLLGTCVRMPSLRRLWLDRMPLGFAVLALSGATNLTSIVFTGCDVDHVTGTLRAALPAATELSVSNL